MPNPEIFKSYPVSGALAPYRIVAFAATAGMVKQATGPTDTLIGTTDELGKQSNGNADVAMTGLPEVQCGAVFAVGVPLTSDANGRAVAATAGQRIIGFGLEPGAVEAVITYLKSPGYAA